MWLLHKNYAVNIKLSNPTSIVDISALKCWDTLDIPKSPRSEDWKVRSVLGWKFLYTLNI